MFPFRHAVISRHREPPASHPAFHLLIVRCQCRRLIPRGRNIGTTQPEEKAAWRLFCWNWCLLGTMTAALFAALALTRFSIEPASALTPIAVIGAYTAYAYYSFRSPQKRDPFVIFTLGSRLCVMANAARRQ